VSTEPRTCDPERVTGWVDDALEQEPRREVEAHLAFCAICQEQASFERELRRRLRELPSLTLPPELAGRVQRGWRPRRLRAAARVLLPLAAVLALVAFWGLRTAPVVAWQLAADHRACFNAKRLPAKVWNSDADRVAAWFDQRGTPVPVVPPAAAGVELLGGRFCYLADRRVAHLYYAGTDRRLSVFVVPGRVLFSTTRLRPVKGESIRFVRAGGTTLALVSEHEETVAGFEEALGRSVAEAISLPELTAPSGR
jgi:anti-sigma factor RsiW